MWYRKPGVTTLAILPRTTVDVRKPLASVKKLDGVVSF
jgi:hypothetical protein